MLTSTCIQIRKFTATMDNYFFLPSFSFNATDSVDIRDRDFKAAKRWSDETVFANRAYFLFEKQPGELAVQNAKDSDSGVYRCRVDFKVAQTRNSKVNLTIIRKYSTQSTPKTHSIQIKRRTYFVNYGIWEILYGSLMCTNLIFIS